MHYNFIKNTLPLILLLLTQLFLAPITSAHNSKHPTINYTPYVEADKITAINIRLQDSDTSSTAHCKPGRSAGWHKCSNHGDLVVSTHNNATWRQDSVLEGLRIKLTGEISKTHDVFYRVNIKDYGWLGWARNNDMAGSINTGLPLIAIRIKLVKKTTRLDLKKAQPMAAVVINADHGMVSGAEGSRSRTRKIEIGGSTYFFKEPEVDIIEYNAMVWRSMGVEMEHFQDTKIRNVATSRMAELLGVSKLIAKSQTAILRKSGEEDVQGNLINQAPGEDFHVFRAISNRPTIGAQMQKNLVSLQVLDAICEQKDRNPECNYFIVTQYGKAIKAIGIDNDLSFGLQTSLKKSNCWGHIKIIGYDNEITLPHLDKNLANKILELTDEQIKLVLFDLLEPEYIRATQERVRQLQEVIRNTQTNNPNFLLNSDDWNEATMQEELDCAYRTYFKLFIKCLNAKKLL